ncbi:Isopentenyl-diphosphate: tRNA isopentenyltransferase [Hyphodiscus hymeniophilus]|uniref:tRNA dimethylallyltransferase n=1 Tax=Hyphodiscus hymeniophilus TaxID=353542 RepID=A0A9P6VII7_9HELO|nr:Isopentenyl-diphosphate: tRNA isopentenyltransferase [Hyphodiscus hymeniophilus]
MARSPPKNPLIVVIGATGTGKSQLAVELATRFNGEIINGDAMQMYDGLPIITNKITAEEQQGIPHHLLGFIGLDQEPWVVGTFRKAASKVIQEIRSRGRLPIVVGGTHYYTQSLLFEDSLVQNNTEGEEEVHPRLSDQEILTKFPILDEPTKIIFEKLKEVDPIMAGRWHPNDRRKIRRSLEIFLQSGRKASDVYAEQKEAKAMSVKPGYSMESEPPQTLPETLLFWVHADSEILKERLDKRVDKMFEAGLLEEVKSMDDFLRKEEASGMTLDRTRGIWASIGWKEFELYLAALNIDSESNSKLSDLLKLSTEQTKAATRQYAKRQTRWIRLKLMPALHDQNALDQLYFLDGSDTNSWADSVSSPAIGVTESFLAGNGLRPPREMSASANQYLSAVESAEIDDLPILQACEICNTTCAGEDQWQAHIRSRRHRALVKKRHRNPNGTSSLPNNESKQELGQTP